MKRTYRHRLVTTALALATFVAFLVTGSAESGADSHALRATIGEQNALRAAESYLSYSAFSRQGLIRQLSSKAGTGYTEAQAVYAVDHVHVSWDVEALKSAKSYLKDSAFSRIGLIRQLSSSAGTGYTEAQAVYAVDHVHVSWDVEALKSAKSYLKDSAFSCQGLIQQLSSSAGTGYTIAQATYAATKIGLC